MPSAPPRELSRARTLSRTRLRIVTAAAALCVSLLGTGALGLGAPAALASGSTTAHSARQSHASTQTRHSQSNRGWEKRFSAKAKRVLRVTRAHKGDPYQYGAAGPHRFDCSGLVMYVFRRALGRSLPHNAEAQLRQSRHLTRKMARPGDLVFQVDSGGYAFHVGIYAGHGWFWDAPHSGSRVREQKMWGGSWRYGRIIRAK